MFSTELWSNPTWRYQWNTILLPITTMRVLTRSLPQNIFKHTHGHLHVHNIWRCIVINVRANSWCISMIMQIVKWLCPNCVHLNVSFCVDIERQLEKHNMLCFYAVNTWTYHEWGCFCLVKQRRTSTASNTTSFLFSYLKEWLTEPDDLMTNVNTIFFMDEGIYQVVVFHLVSRT